jgi:hypothetical protein
MTTATKINAAVNTLLIFLRERSFVVPTRKIISSKPMITPNRDVVTRSDKKAAIKANQTSLFLFSSIKLHAVGNSSKNSGGENIGLCVEKNEKILKPAKSVTITTTPQVIDRIGRKERCVLRKNNATTMLVVGSNTANVVAGILMVTKSEPAATSTAQTISKIIGAVYLDQGIYPLVEKMAQERQSPLNIVSEKIDGTKKSAVINPKNKNRQIAWVW